MAEEEKSSAREERDAKRQLAVAQQAARERKLRASIDAVLRTDAGKELFKYLFTVCGWTQADIPQDAINRPDGGQLLYNATRRNVYARLRAKASRELLAPVEAAAEDLLTPNAEEKK